MLVLLLVISILAVSAQNTGDFITANNLFTSSLYKEVSKINNGNFLISPFSTEVALAFLQSGAKGKTSDEIKTALHLPEKDKVQSALKELLPQLKGSNEYELYTANKLYVKRDFSIYDTFKKDASEVYLADAESINFEEEGAAEKMNKWVEEQTNNKIKNLINAQDLDDFTRAMLINSVYFNANWSEPFSFEETQKKNFYKTPNDVVKVDTLHHEEQFFNHYNCPHLKAQFLELPFKEGGASMIIVLPNEKNGITEIENHLDKVFTPQHKLKMESMNVALPKFKIETSTNLKSVLENLGVRRVFSHTEADLSGIADRKHSLYVEKVAQKTYINVGELGVEAAAATYVEVSTPRVASIPVDFKADHPFIFYIKIGKLIILSGRVTDPSKI